MSIRAYRRQQVALNEEIYLIDENSRAFYTLQLANLWLNVRLDAVRHF